MALGNLLDSAAPVLATLEGPVSDGLPPKTLDLEKAQNFDVYGQTVGIKGDLTASLEIHPLGQTVAVAGGFYPPPADSAFVEAQVTARANLESEGSTAVGGGVTLGFSARGGLNLSYRHVLAALGSEAKSQALERLVASSTLPQLLKPAELGDATLQSLEFDSFVDFGITASYGLVKQYQTSLFGNSKVPFDLGINAALNASFGLGLSGSLDFTLERISNLAGQPTWVRAIVHKKHENRLSLAAKLDLEVNYDLGTGLLGLLDQVLGTPPVKQLFGEIDQVSAVLEQVASGQALADLPQKISTKVSAVLSTYLDKGLDQVFSYIDTEDGRKVLGQLLEVSKAYQNLDGEIQDLWNRVLAYGNLQAGSPFADALALIAKLDPNNLEASLEDLLSANAQAAVAALQDLTGRTLEDMVIGDDALVKQWLARAVALAKQMQGFIEQFPADVAGRVKDFAVRTGIDGTMRWLDANIPADGDLTTFENTLKAKAGELMQERIQGLIDRAVAQIDPAYLAQIQDFAKQVLGYIDQIGDKKQQLQDMLAKLKGTTGLSLSFEWERVVSRTALVDVSFDPADPDMLAAFAKLAAGDVQGFLAALPEKADHYALHDSLLTSTKALTFTFGIFGVKNTNQRIYSSSLRLIQEPDDAKERRGAYSGSFSNIITENGKPWQATVALTAQAAAANGNFDLPYDHVIFDLLLTISRNDDQTSAAELAGLLELINLLGFPGIYEQIQNAHIAEGTGTRLALSLDLRLGSLDTLLNLSDPAKTDLAFLNAGFLWHNTPLAMRAPDGDKGAELAWYIANSKNYRDHFDQPTSLNGLPVIGPNNLKLKTVNFWPSLKYMADARWQAVAQYKRMKATFDSAVQAKTDAALLGLMQAYANYARDTTATGGWTSPMFAVFGPLALLQQYQPAQLKGIRAAGTFRWQADGAWQAPIFLNNRNGFVLPQFVTG